MGIFRQPLEAFALFGHAHLEITLKLVRRESVCAAQDLSPRAIGPRELGQRFWIFRIISVAGEIRGKVELELAIQQTNCCPRRSALPGSAITARIGSRLVAY